MKKQVLHLLAVAIMMALPQQMMADDVVIDNNTFPDDNFRSWVLEQEYGKDGVLTDDEIASVTKIAVWFKGITNLKGIEHFTALTELDCVGNRLTELDVSKNTALTELDCISNNLTTLDVSKNTALKYFTCALNQLTSLDVSKNTALTVLECHDNQLTSLNVSKNTALTRLNCGDNQLTSLDVSKNTALTELHCNGNQLTSLDVSKNTALNQLQCYENQLTAIDVSKNSELAFLNCSMNLLTTLDVSKNTALTDLSCYDNQLTVLDVSKNTELQVLFCRVNMLTTIDVSKNTLLKSLDCGENPFTSLDVSMNTALTNLWCYGNQLTTLDVSKNTALTGLYCSDNQLTSLDVSKNTALERLYCGSNQIKGAAMDALIVDLSGKGGGFYAIMPDDGNEKNVVTKTQVAAAKAKGWITYYWSSESNNWLEYEGSDEQTISPVDEGEVIDIGTEIDENTNLDGNVVDNVYFNINDGSYDASGGCIVVNSPTDDSFINGQDIFGDDFKEGYNGIVFMVPAGEGTINVEAETTGDMVLKVKIGNKKPITMVLNGKLTISFPYDVTEDTYVYIYGGTSSAGAKGMSRAAGSGSLKIYGIEVVGGENGIENIESSKFKVQSSKVYNLNGQRVISSPSGRPGGVPMKGVFIKNGKKVLMK